MSSQLESVQLFSLQAHGFASEDSAACVRNTPPPSLLCTVPRDEPHDYRSTGAFAQQQQQWREDGSS